MINILQTVVIIMLIVFYQTEITLTSELTVDRDKYLGLYEEKSLEYIETEDTLLTQIEFDLD